MTKSQSIKALSLGAAIAAALTSGIASAEVTANATLASNYIWRGISQTGDQAAGQGGIDWSHSSGLYVGTWLSNVDFSLNEDIDVVTGPALTDTTTVSSAVDGRGFENDVYIGFGGEVGSFAYDLGLATYMYPVTPEFNFTEAYVSGTFSVVTVGLAYTVDAASGNDAEKTPGAAGVFDQGDMYVYGSLDFAPKGLDVSLYAGSYMFENSDKSYANGNSYGDLDYVNYGASIGKNGFALAVDKTDIDNDRTRVTVSYTKDFELL